MGKVNTAEEFYREIATPESIAALNGLLRSSFFKRAVLNNVVAFAHQWYTNKSSTRYFWYFAYGFLTAAAGITFAVATVTHYVVANALSAVTFGKIGWSNFDTGVLWGILRQGDEEGNLSSKQMWTLLFAEVAKHPEVFRLLDEMPSTVDQVLDIALAAKPEAKSADINPPEEPTPVFLTAEILGAILQTTKSIIGGHKSTILSLLAKEKILGFVPDELKNLIKDKKLNDKVLELSDLLVSEIARLTGGDLEAILSAYNNEQTQKFLAYIQKTPEEQKAMAAPDLPVELIKTAMPLLKVLLASEAVRKLVASVLKNKNVVGIIKSYMPKEMLEEYEGLIDDVLLNPSIVENALNLYAEVLDGAGDKQIETLLEALNAEDTKNYLKAQEEINKDKKADGIIDVPVPATLISAAHPVLLNLLKHNATKEKLSNLLKDEASLKVLKQLLPEELVVPVGEAMRDGDMLTQTLQLLQQTLETLPAAELMPVTRELIKQEMDVGRVIEELVPIIGKALKFKKQLDTVAKKDPILNLAISAYEKMLVDDEQVKKELTAEELEVVKEYAKKEAEELRVIIAPVVKDKDVLMEVLTLSQIAVTELKDASMLSRLYKVIAEDLTKDNKLPADIILASLPILQMELKSNPLKASLKKLVSLATVRTMGLSFYSQSLDKDEKLTKEERKKAVTQAIGVAQTILADKIIVGQSIDLCGAVVGILSIENLTSVLAVYNSDQTQDWLAYIQKAPEEQKAMADPDLPVELIKAAMPLLKVLLANKAVRKLLVSLLSNATVVGIIKSYLPEEMLKEYEGLIDAALLQPSIVKNALKLCAEVLSGAGDEQIETLLEALNAEDTKNYLKALEEQDVPVPAALINAAHPILLNLLKHTATREKLSKLLKDKAFDEVLKQLLPKELVAPARSVINDEDTLSQALQLLQTTLEILPAAELIPVTHELIKQEMDVGQVIEELVPILGKALKFKKQLDTIAKKEPILNLAISAYEKMLVDDEQVKKKLNAGELQAIKEAARKEAEELRVIIAPVVKDKDVLMEVLTLGQIVVSELNGLGLLKKLYEVFPKDKIEEGTLAVDAALDSIAILQVELKSEQVRTAIEKVIRSPVLKGIGLGFYKKTLSSEDAKAVDTVLKDKTIIAQMLSLCSAVANVLTVDNFKPVLVAYNAPQTQKFLAELKKGPDDPKDPTAPALPVELIKAAMPLIREVLSNQFIVSAIEAIMNNSGVEKGVVAFFGKDSDEHKIFMWAKGNTQDLLKLAHAASLTELKSVIDEVNEYLVNRNQAGANLGELSQEFVKKMLGVVKNDSTGLLAIIAGNPILISRLVNTYPDIPMQFANLDEIIAKAVPTVKSVLGSIKDEDLHVLVYGAVADKHKNKTIKKIDAVIKAYVAQVNKEPAKLTRDLTDILKPNEKRSYAGDLKIYLSDIFKNPKSPVFKGVGEQFDVLELDAIFKSVLEALDNGGLYGSSIQTQLGKLSKTPTIVMLEVADAVLSSQDVIGLNDLILEGIEAKEGKEELEEQLGFAKDVFNYYGGSYELISLLLKAVKLHGELKDKDKEITNGLVKKESRDDLAEECQGAYNKFFSRLEEMLTTLKQKGKLKGHSSMLANLLNKVIPDSIKEAITSKSGNTIYSFAQELCEKPASITPILYPVMSMVLGRTGVVSGVANSFFQSPMFLLGKTYGALKAAAFHSTNHLNAILRQKGLTIEDRIDDYINNNQPNYNEKSRILSGALGSTKYNDLKFKKLTVQRLKNSNAISIAYSKISGSLSLISSTIEEMSVASCAIDNLEVGGGSILTGCVFNGSTITNLNIDSASMDASTFISLMTAISDKKAPEFFSINDLKIIDNLMLACEAKPWKLAYAISCIPNLDDFIRVNPNFADRVGDFLFTEANVVNAFVEEMESVLVGVDKDAIPRFRQYLEESVRGLDPLSLKELLNMKRDLIGVSYGMSSTSYFGILEYLNTIEEPATIEYIKWKLATALKTEIGPDGRIQPKDIDTIILRIQDKVDSRELSLDSNLTVEINKERLKVSISAVVKSVRPEYLSLINSNIDDLVGNQVWHFLSYSYTGVFEAASKSGVLEDDIKQVFKTILDKQDLFISKDESSRTV